MKVFSVVILTLAIVIFLNPFAFAAVKIVHNASGIGVYTNGTLTYQSVYVNMDGSLTLYPFSFVNGIVVQNTTVGQYKVTDGTNTLSQLNDDGTSGTYLVNTINASDININGTNVVVSDNSSQQIIRSTVVTITTNAAGYGYTNWDYTDFSSGTPVLSCTVAEEMFSWSSAISVWYTANNTIATINVLSGVASSSIDVGVIAIGIK